VTALAAVVALFLASAATAVTASLTGRRALVAVTKPLTTLLLFPVLGWPRMPVAWWIAVGLLLSLGGDVALLGSTKRAFIVGLVLFLLAHVAYILGFVSAAMWATGGDGPPVAPMVVSAIAVGLATALLLRRLWPGAGELRLPVAIYGVVISVMVVSAVAAVAARPSSPLSIAVGMEPVGAVGAVLFYVSDAALALSLFHRPFRWAPLLTLGVYWLGQLGIALAARWSSG
jgi:alkenylglycerophosphocholine hydrolase